MVSRAETAAQSIGSLTPMQVSAPTVFSVSVIYPFIVGSNIVFDVADAQGALGSSSAVTVHNWFEVALHNPYTTTGWY